MRSFVFASLAVGLLAVACAPKSTPASSPASGTPPAQRPRPLRRAAPPPPPPRAAADSRRCATPSGCHAPRRRAGDARAAAPRAVRRHRRCAGGGRGGRGTPPPPPPPPPAVMPPPVTPVVSATAPTPDPRVGLAAGSMGRGAGGVEPEDGVDDAAGGEIPRRHELGPRVHGQVRHPGQLQRVPDLRHVEPGQAEDRA